MTALLRLPEIQPDAVEVTAVPFGEWLPDQPTVNNPGAVEALNVMPADSSYVPFPQFIQEEAATLADTVRGALAVALPNDVTQVYAGTVAGIFTRVGGNAFASISSLATTVDDPWKFIRVNEQMVVISGSHVPQRTPIGTTTATVNVGGNPPTALCGAQVTDFLVLGNLQIDPDDGNGLFPSRVRWGGFNNVDSPWITDPATQADFQDMPAEGGPVIAIAGREVGTVYQERMISTMSYKGLPEVWNFVVREDKVGCIARDSVVDIGGYQFFIAEDGFRMWNGVNSSPIGDKRVNKYFFNRLQYGLRSRITGAVDFRNGCILWAFPTTPDGVLDEIIIYSYRENRWSHSIQTLEYLFNSSDSNITLDELTGMLVDNQVGSLVDDPIYTAGGRAQLAAFDLTHTYGLFVGDPMAATLDTGEYSGPDSRRLFVNRARPLVDSPTPNITVQAVGRDQLMGQAIGFGPAAIQEADGTCPVLADARYMRFRVNIPAGNIWQHAIGVEISRKAGGQF